MQPLSMSFSTESIGNCIKADDWTQKLMIFILNVKITELMSFVFLPIFRGQFLFDMWLINLIVVNIHCRPFSAGSLNAIIFMICVHSRLWHKDDGMEILTIY